MSIFNGAGILGTEHGALLTPHPRPRYSPPPSTLTLTLNTHHHPHRSPPPLTTRPRSHPHPHPHPGSELGALLTDALGVSPNADGQTDFTNLGLLVFICNLSSLLPLFALDWLDEAGPPADDGAADGDSYDESTSDTGPHARPAAPSTAAS